MTVVRDDASMPPYYDRSLAEMDKLRKQQALTVNLGVERVRFTGLPALVDPDVKIAFCATALRRPTVLMALTINLALTWKRRQNITRFVVDFNENKDELTHPVIEALEPAIRCGHVNLSIKGLAILACVHCQEYCPHDSRRLLPCALQR